MNINFFGTLRAPTSRAHVTREMTIALAQRGHDVSITDCRGFLHDSGFPLPQELVSIMDRPRHTEFEISFDYPPNYHRLQAEKRIGMLVYETSVLPPHWRDAILEHLHLLVVPSRFCADIMLAAGIPEHMIEVVPFGVRPALFQPEDEWESTELFKFLCVAMPHKRKALDILLRAYCNEFSADEDVCLIIKSPYRADPERMQPWEMDLDHLLNRIDAQPDSPEILYLSEAWPIEALPALYVAGDCYVQPSRSEGFGLAILEAFACAKPAIVTGWGGHMEFCEESNSYIIDHSLVPANEIQYDNDSPDAQIALPNEGHLASLMRAAYEDPAGLRKKSAAALNTAVHYSWAAAAEKLENALLRLDDRS